MKPRIIFAFIFIVIISQCLNKEEQKSKPSENKTTTETPIAPPIEPPTEQLPEEPNPEEVIEIPTAPIIMPTKLPQSKVILPIRRLGTSESTLNAAPCGGVSRREANTLTNNATDIHFVWETVIPSSNSNCTVKISPGIEKEENFTVLMPKGNIANAKGEFACGANKGFEGQEFILPDNFVCDKCTLQWRWNTPYGVIYSCSDVIINGDKIGHCLAKCQNGGSCFNGQCICADDYHGEFCQHSDKSSVNVGTVLLIIFAILLIIGLIVAAVFLLKPDNSWLKTMKERFNAPFSNEKEEYNASDDNQ